MEEDERPQSPEDDEEATRKPTAVERRLEQRVTQLEEARSASILAQAAAEAICKAKDAELLRMHARIGEAEQRGQNAAEVEEVVSGARGGAPRGRFRKAAQERACERALQRLAAEAVRERRRRARGRRC